MSDAARPEAAVPGPAEVPADVPAVPRRRGRPAGSGNRGATIISILRRRCPGCERPGCEDARREALEAVGRFYAMHGSRW